MKRTLSLLVLAVAPVLFASGQQNVPEAQSNLTLATSNGQSQSLNRASSHDRHHRRHRNRHRRHHRSPGGN